VFRAIALIRNPTSLLPVILVYSLFVQGCGTLDNGRRLGEDVTLLPGWNRLGEAAIDAATSPMVFVPAATALLLQIDNADERISHWAMKHTPIAGSNERAERLSKDLRNVSAGFFYASILAAPGGNEPISWGASKARGAAVQCTAAFLNNKLVYTLKNATDQKRPDNCDNMRFPSSRASDTALFTSFATKNISTMNIPRPLNTALNTALTIVMFVVAWERVEAGAHYPSDVLAGISQGYFISSFMNDSFMNLNQDAQGGPIVGIDGNGIFIGYYGRF